MNERYEVWPVLAVALSVSFGVIILLIYLLNKQMEEKAPLMRTVAEISSLLNDPDQPGFQPDVSQSELKDWRLFAKLIAVLCIGAAVWKMI